MRSSYRVGEFRDPLGELDRLALQARVIEEAEDAAFRAVGFPDAGDGVELGCGPGYVAQRIIARRPEARVLGVDIDPGLVAKARERIEAVEGDAMDLSLEADRFDFGYCRLLLRHLPDPSRALASLHRVVRGAGRVVVLDTDDGTLILDPVPPGFDELMAVRHESIRQLGADPCMGRRLRRLFLTHAFDDVVTRTITASTEDIGTAAFTKLALLPFAEGIAECRMAPSEVRKVVEGVQVWADHPASYGAITAFIVGGRPRK